MTCQKRHERHGVVEGQNFRPAAQLPLHQRGTGTGGVLAVTARKRHLRLETFGGVRRCLGATALLLHEIGGVSPAAVLLAARGNALRRNGAGL